MKEESALKDPTQRQEDCADLDEMIPELSIKNHICYYPVYFCVVGYKKYAEPAMTHFDRFIDNLTIYPNIRWLILVCLLSAHIGRVYYLSKG